MLAVLAYLPLSLPAPAAVPQVFEGVKYIELKAELNRTLTAGSFLWEEITKDTARRLNLVLMDPGEGVENMKKVCYMCKCTTDSMSCLSKCQDKFGCSAGPDERNTAPRVAVVNAGWAGVPQGFSYPGTSWELQTAKQGRGGLP